MSYIAGAQSPEYHHKSAGIETVKPWLEVFESLVLSQQPATQPWQPVTDYSFEARKAIEGLHPQLIKDVFQPLLVCDAGCGRTAILPKLLGQINVSGIGFDPTIELSEIALKRLAF